MTPTTSVSLPLEAMVLQAVKQKRNQTGLSEEELEDPSSLHLFEARCPLCHFCSSIFFYQAAQSYGGFRNGSKRKRAESSLG